MKQFRVYRDLNEARMSAGLLEAHGLTVIVDGAKEYASVVTGSGEGHYKLMMAPEHFDQATEILATVERAYRAGLDLVEDDSLEGDLGVDGSEDGESSEGAADGSRKSERRKGVQGTANHRSLRSDGLRGQSGSEASGTSAAQGSKHIAETTPNALLATSYFRKAVIMSLLATFMVPIFFNVAALLCARSYWRFSKRDQSAIARIAIILLLQIPSLWTIRWYIHYFG